MADVSGVGVRKKGRGANDLALDELPDLVLVVQRADLAIVDVNVDGAAALGFEPADLKGQKLTEFAVDGADRLSDEFESAGSNGALRFNLGMPLEDGTKRIYNFATNLADDSATCVLVGRELDALDAAHSQLSALLMLADLSEEIFVVSDRLGTVQYTNAAAARVHGEQEFVGRHVADFVHEDDTGFEKLIGAVLGGHERAEARVLARRADGSPMTLEVRMVYHRESDRWFTVERDVTAAVAQEARLEALTADLHRRATTDALTGVANRAAFAEHVQSALAQARDFAVLLLDMDNFKSVNDEHGHAAGDEFLQSVARRMKTVVGSTGLVARLGGDEFVACLSDSQDALGIAEKVRDALAQPFALGSARVSRSCSIGVATRRADDDYATLLWRADQAAYVAKHKGRDRVAFGT